MSGSRGRKDRLPGSRRGHVTSSSSEQDITIHDNDKENKSYHSGVPGDESRVKAAYQRKQESRSPLRDNPQACSYPAGDTSGNFTKSKNVATVQDTEQTKGARPKVKHKGSTSSKSGRKTEQVTSSRDSQSTESDADNDRRYQQWREAGAALRETLARMTRQSSRSEANVPTSRCSTSANINSVTSSPARGTTENAAIARSLGYSASNASGYNDPIVSSVLRHLSQEPDVDISSEASNAPFSSQDIRSSAIASNLMKLQQLSHEKNNKGSDTKNLKTARNRVQEISEKYKLSTFNNSKSKKKLLSLDQGRFLKSSGVIYSTTSSDSEGYESHKRRDMDIHKYSKFKQNTWPKCNKAKKTMTPLKLASQEDITRLIPNNELLPNRSREYPSGTQDDTAPQPQTSNGLRNQAWCTFSMCWPSKTKPVNTATNTTTTTTKESSSDVEYSTSDTGEGGRQNFRQSPVPGPSGIGTHAKQCQNSVLSSMLASRYLEETDSVLNLADISSISESTGEGSGSSSPTEDVPTLTTNTPECTLTRRHKSNTGTLERNRVRLNELRQEFGYDDSDTGNESDMLEELTDFVTGYIDSSDDENDCSVTLSVDDINSLPVISTESSSSGSSDSADADDEFECECLLCQCKLPVSSGAATDNLAGLEARLNAEFGSQIEPLAEEAIGLDPDDILGLDIEEITSMENLMQRQGSRDVLEVMFTNVIMQMLAVYPELLSDHAPPPASHRDISSLPRITITEEQTTDESACPICLCHFSLEEQALRMPCRHLFHSLCLQAWLRKSATCPVCRQVLGSDQSVSS